MWENGRMTNFMGKVIFMYLGVYLFQSGERFMGQLKNGQKNGYGTYYYNNGNIYEGNWYKIIKLGQMILKMVKALITI